MKKKITMIGAFFIMFLITASGQHGTVEWIYSVGTVHSDLRGCPAIADDGTIYIASRNEKLSAVNPDGTFKWEFQTLGSAWGSPCIDANGTIYIGSNISNENYNNGLKNNFYAINPDGTLKWSAEVGILVDNSPAIGPDGTIYMPSSDGLSAFNTDGTLKWNLPEIGNSYTTPAISANGTIYLAGYTGLYAINPNGTIKWYTGMEDDTRSSPAVGVDGTIYIGSKDNYFYAFNPTDGTEKWKFNAGSMILSAPILDENENIYFGTYKGKFYALNSDGTEKWNYQFSEDMGFLENNGAILGDNNVIYLVASDPIAFYLRKVYALNLDGTLNWELQLGDVLDTPPTLAADGTIYIGATDGKFYAISGESTGAADSPWPKYRGNNKNTGLAVDNQNTSIGIFSLNNNSFEVSCYPNPFKTNITIDISLEKQEHVSVEIYSTIGVELASLYNGLKNSGNHSFIFSNEKMEINSAGLYICKVQVGMQTKTSLIFAED